MEIVIKNIGYIDSDKEIFIKVDYKYRKALINVDKFSHIHIFYLSENKIRDAIIKINNVDLANGVIEAKGNLCLGKYQLIDIKPYMPSEDSIEINCVKHDEQLVQVNGNVVKTIGTIRNNKGLIYLELTEELNIQDTYLKIIWWFNGFDKKNFRENTMCNPPYENAPQSGVFATRSPVRPNLLALTIVKVIKKEGQIIYINGIESFDNTPLLGIVGYDSNNDFIDEATVPTYLSHWPRYINFNEWNKDLDNIETKSSKLFSLVYMNKNKNEIVKAIKNENNVSGIIIKNAYENNLKNIDVSIPYNKLTAVIGVSGSGKSSLVDDTIYQECQRKMEYLNRNRTLLNKPKVDSISGILPAIRIKQDTIRGSIMSTVGTYTNIYDPLRVLFSTIGLRHCPDCGEEIIPLTESKIIELVTNNSLDIFDLNKRKIFYSSIKDGVHEALESGNGAMYVKIDNDFVLLQTKEKCYHCNKIMFNLSPSTFSYLNTEARCPVCNGRGEINEVDVNKIITNPNISLLEGAIDFYGKLKNFLTNPNANWMKGQVIGLANSENVDLNLKWIDLPDKFKQELLYGINRIVTFDFYNKSNGRTGKIQRPVEGLIPLIKRLFNEETDPKIIDKYFSKIVCPTCHNERLNKEGRMVTVCDVRYPLVANYTFGEMQKFIEKVESEYTANELIKVSSCISIIKEIIKSAERLGLSYLSLSQSTATLSTGEAQRIKLLGAYLNHMSHILYIFDEPSKGLDPRDYYHVMKMMDSLKQESNTIIMVEHNLDMIKLADNIIEMGPKAGMNGGQIVAQGTYEQLLNNKNTELNKCQLISRLTEVRELKNFVKYTNLSTNYLKNISVNIPKNAITVIYGVSGSGKSTMLKKEIYPKTLENNDFDDCILVDSSPIGKNNKSVIATYIGIMDEIRLIFANSDDAKLNKMNEKYFSFNQSEGACDKCHGDGRIELDFFKDTYITCSDCNGTRYNSEVLKIKYQGKSISDVLNLSIDEAIKFIKDKEIISKLKFLEKVGLGYLLIGQTTSSLSGGEASRLKLAKELMKGKKKNTLYLFDEPTIGLHFSDIQNLLLVINELLKDNTVVAIEHNRQFLLNSDYFIELGPGAGALGGEVIFEGKK